MSIIATLVPHPVQLQRLRGAMRNRHTVVECESWEEVLDACDRQPVQMVIADLYATGPVSFEDTRQLKNRFPGVTLVAYVAFAPERVRDLFDAGRAGHDGLVLADVDDSPRHLLQLLDEAEARSITGLVRRSLADLPPFARDAVLIAVSKAHERLAPAALAQRLRVSRRVLSERLAEAGLPPAQQLLTWGRLILAGQMLQDRQRSADKVAIALAFPSASAFRNTCRRYLAATPGEIRARGGAAYVIRTFLRTFRPVERQVGIVTHRQPSLAV